MRVTVGDGFQTQDEELLINGLNTAGEIVNNVTIGEYDVVVSSRPARDNYEDIQFITALQMREAGVMIPDDVVIRHSQMDNKDAIADRVAELQGTAPPSEEEIRIAMMQQELDFRRQMAEVGKMEAEIQELQARSAQSFAKARALEGEAQAAAVEMGIDARRQAADLQAKLEMFYADLQNKLQLAGIHSQNKREVTAMSEGTKHSIAELNLLAKPQPQRNSDG